MSKRHHVAYIKPNEPSFLKRLKEEAGYKEGPTLDTKREIAGSIDDEDLADTQEEQPTVVVLKTGDLTAEEAAEVSHRLKKAEEEAPADLNKPIVFKSRPKEKPSSREATTSGKSSTKRSSTSSREDGTKPKKSKTPKSLLSFDEDEDF